MINSENKITDMDSLFSSLKTIKGKKGIIKIKIGNVSTISTANDVVGKCVEEWINTWFHEKNKSKSNPIELIPNQDTQEFPDYEVKFDGKLHPMDIKCFNYNNNPSFDVSNFDSFIKSIFESPEKLFADYFIFPYLPCKPGDGYSFIIKDVYRKKIWEIVGTDLNKKRKYPITMQVKKGNPYAIRPGGFSRDGVDTNEPNEDLRNLLNKIMETGEQYKRFGADGMPSLEEWKKKVFKYIN